MIPTLIDSPDPVRLVLATLVDKLNSTQAAVPHHVVLTGGTHGMEITRGLAQVAAAVPSEIWAQTHLWWGDERFVESTSRDRNDYEIKDVVIETRGGSLEGAVTTLYQNEPNPFKGQTTIGFTLAERGSATMTVFDVTGKLLANKTIDGVKGYNTVNFTAEQLGVSGVLYYTLESGDFTATKKMIIIE